MNPEQDTCKFGLQGCVAHLEHVREQLHGLLPEACCMLKQSSASQPRLHPEQTRPERIEHWGAQQGCQYHTCVHAQHTCICFSPVGFPYGSPEEGPRTVGLRPSLSAKAVTAFSRSIAQIVNRLSAAANAGAQAAGAGELRMAAMASAMC